MELRAAALCGGAGGPLVAGPVRGDVLPAVRLVPLLMVMLLRVLEELLHRDRGPHADDGKTLSERLVPDSARINASIQT